ncbi:hypothetical protein KAR48_11230 [bacterium]|nr:hypothetical protein [bacterium]
MSTGVGEESKYSNKIEKLELYFLIIVVVLSCYYAGCDRLCIEFLEVLNNHCPTGIGLLEKF